MELLLSRNTYTENSTIGTLHDNGVMICHILEDKDRGLAHDMPLEMLQKIKVYGQTAIPSGKYQIIITQSARLTAEKGVPTSTPILLNVPDYEGVRIHPGNYSKDTLGCLLPGRIAGNDMVLHSVDAYNDVLHLIQSALDKGEEVWLTIDSQKQPEIIT